MTFQFQCPHCHQVLEGDPAQASQVCQCPTCQQQFIIPAPAAQASAPPHSTAAPQGPAVPQVGPQFGPPATTPHHVEPEEQTSFPQVDPRMKSNPFDTGEAKMFHIPCPNCPDKRLLETPAEMLGQDAICPHCGIQLRLREKDSVEFKRKRREEAEIKELKQGDNWLNWAIVFAVLVILLVGGLIFISSGN